MKSARWIVTFTAALALALPPLTANAAETTIVMSGLNNPRGLAFAANGALYVAEAGRGGTQQCFAGPGGGPHFAGRTGSISRLWRGVQQRVVTGLASHAPADGSGALGPHDVLPIGKNRLSVTVGLGTNPASRSLCAPIGRDFGWLVRTRANDGWRNLVDLAAYEARANPDGGEHDSNPYGLLVPTRGARDDDDDDDGDDEDDDRRNGDGGEIIATDAGGNSLLAIRPDGRVRTLATFPSRSNSDRLTDSVPTSVARGPDGALYVGELTGFPFTPGAARVYRVTASGAVSIFRSGFTAITDIAFGGDGSLYVLEFATGPFLAPPGDLVRVTPAGVRTIIATNLVAPTSVAIGPDGAFYVSNCGIAPAGGGPPPCAAVGGGHVLRVRP